MAWWVTNPSCLYDLINYTTPLHRIQVLYQDCQLGSGQSGPVGSCWRCPTRVMLLPADGCWLAQEPIHLEARFCSLSAYVNCYQCCYEYWPQCTVLMLTYIYIYTVNKLRNASDAVVECLPAMNEFESKPSLAAWGGFQVFTYNEL